MTGTNDSDRRRILKQLALGLSMLPIAASRIGVAMAADPLVTSDDATAKAVKYVSDASKSTDAKPGSHCGTCMLYQGAAGSTQGGCPIFPGKQVSASGWCASWTAKS